MVRILTCSIIVMALVLCMASCGGKTEDSGNGVTAGGPTSSSASSGEPDYRIALIMKAGSNPFFDAMEKGALAAGEELGVEVLPSTITDESQDQQQIDIVEAMIADQVDAILIAPANSKSLVAPLMSAQEAGIPVINVDNRLDAETVESAGLELISYVGADNEEGGRLAGEYLCELLGGEGKLAMLEGRRGVDNAEARKKGFETACAQYDGIEILTSEPADWDMTVAQDKFSTLMDAYPDIEGLFCANDNMALGALGAITEKGKDGEIIVVSYDNIAPAQEAIKAGKLAATIEQHPDLMGGQAVRTAVKYLQGEEIDAEVLVDLEVITADSLSD